MTGVLLLTIAAPFAVLYGVHLIKNGNYSAHKDIQIIAFILSLIGVLTLERLIRFSEGSGSPTMNSDTHLKKVERWTTGNYLRKAYVFGKTAVIGLFYTAISALIVYVMTLGLI